MERYHPELTAPILSLSFSESFKAMSVAQGFRTLTDIISWPVAVLLQHEGFTYHHYYELWRFMRQNSLC